MTTEKTLTVMCAYLRNWFERESYAGKFRIENGVLIAVDAPDFTLTDGQYYRICRSLLNDGVHKNGGDALVDEGDFTGVVWSMAIPPAVVDLATEIEAWNEKYAAASASPYQSESFGGYSYSKASGTNGGAVSWQTQFKSQLSPWRKI